jgi:hypothetical protein
MRGVVRRLSAQLKRDRPVDDDIDKFNRFVSIKGVGFAFSSDIGIDLIDIMRVSTMGEILWDVVRVSAEQARDYCLDPENRCLASYAASRSNR